MASQIHHVQEPIVLLKHQQGIALCLIVCGKRQKENQYKVCSMAGCVQSAVPYMAHSSYLVIAVQNQCKLLAHTEEAVKWDD